jgi:hypothetical protein
MEDMKSGETDALSKKKMNEILQRLQGNEENNSNTGMYVCLKIISVQLLNMMVLSSSALFSEKKNRFIMIQGSPAWIISS